MGPYHQGCRHYAAVKRTRSQYGVSGSSARLLLASLHFKQIIPRNGVWRKRSASLCVRSSPSLRSQQGGFRTLDPLLGAGACTTRHPSERRRGGPTESGALTGMTGLSPEQAASGRCRWRLGTGLRIDPHQAENPVGMLASVVLRDEGAHLVTKRSSPLDGLSSIADGSRYHFSPNGRISSSKVQALRGC
jgi:hypothetical protein